MTVYCCVTLPFELSTPTPQFHCTTAYNPSPAQRYTISVSISHGTVQHPDTSYHRLAYVFSALQLHSTSAMHKIPQPSWGLSANLSTEVPVAS